MGLACADCRPLINAEYDAARAQRGGALLFLPPEPGDLRQTRAALVASPRRRASGG